MAINDNTPTLTLDEFRATIGKDDGPAKASRFVMRISPPAGNPTFGGDIFQDLQFLCESTELPGREFIANQLRHYGPEFKIPYHTSYGDLQVTFLCRDKFRERKLFDDWMELIQPTGSYDFNYKKSYISTIEVFMMSDIGEIQKPDVDPCGLPIPRANPMFTNPVMKDKHTYKMIYEEAYPISVGTQGLNGSDSDFMRLNVIFAYTKWKRDTLSTPEIYKLVDFAGGIGKDNLVLPSAALDGKNTVLPI